jgi:hypothetical protein
MWVSWKHLSGGQGFQHLAPLRLGIVQGGHYDQKLRSDQRRPKVGNMPTGSWPPSEPSGTENSYQEDRQGRPWSDHPVTHKEYNRISSDTVTLRYDPIYIPFISLEPHF